MAKIYHFSIFLEIRLSVDKKLYKYIHSLSGDNFPKHSLSSIRIHLCTLLWPKFTISLYSLEILLSVDKKLYKYTFSLLRSFPQTLPELYTDHQLYFIHSSICIYHITKYIYSRKIFTLYLILSVAKKFATF